MTRPCILVIAVFLFLYILPLGVHPLLVPDETRYAEISREMIASGDWVVPHLDGLRYFEKPVLGYWVNAAAIRVLGENEFAVRLSSALAVGLTSLLLGLWARRYRSDALAGMLAAVVFLLSFEVYIIGVSCVLDSLFSLFVTATILFFHFAHQPSKLSSRVKSRDINHRTSVLRPLSSALRSHVLLILSGVCCGLAFLTKGPLGVVVPAVVLAPFVLWERRLKVTLKMLWLPCIAAVLVALPWSLMIWRREPDFWHYFLWVEHVDRFIHPRPGQHAKPLWYYVPIILGGAMPWTPLIGTVVQGVRRTGFKHSMIRLALCWLVLPFLFFSLSSGKLGTYILVSFPALAFLIAVGLIQCLRQGDNKGFVIGTGLVAAGTGILLCVLVLSFFVPLPGLPFLAHDWLWLLTALGLLAWCLLSLAAIMQIRRVGTAHRSFVSQLWTQPILLYWLAPALFMFSWHFVMAVVASPDKTPGAFLLSNGDCGAGADSVLVSDSTLAAAACWYYKRADIFILGGQGEYEYGLGYEDSKHRLVQADQFQDLIARSAGKRCVALVMGTGRYHDCEPQLPQPLIKNTVDDLVFAQFECTGTSLPR